MTRKTHHCQALGRFQACDILPVHLPGVISDLLLNDTICLTLKRMPQLLHGDWSAGTQLTATRETAQVPLQAPSDATGDGSLDHSVSTEAANSWACASLVQVEPADAGYFCSSRSKPIVCHAWHTAGAQSVFADTGYVKKPVAESILQTVKHRPSVLCYQLGLLCSGRCPWTEAPFEETQAAAETPHPIPS